jgi:hypothetical protein
LRRPTSGRRDFGSKAAAFKAGGELLDEIPYSFIGNLDADITLPADYYERVLAAFKEDARLGIAGGTVYTKIGERFISHDHTSDSVGGAVQFFTKDCFEEVGGYMALEHGGIDAAAEITARMHGWTVRKVPELRVYEHRRTGSAQDGPLAAMYKLGVRFHTLGYSTVFFLIRCAYRAMEKPILIGSALSLLGFAAAKLKRYPVSLPPEAVSYLRSEQIGKLRNAMTRAFKVIRRFPISTLRSRAGAG